MKLFQCSKEDNTVVGVCVAIAVGLIGAAGMFVNTSWSGGGEPSRIAGATFLDGRSRDRVVNLRGEWRFSTGDDLRRAGGDYDDGDWQEVDVPANWEGEGHRGYDGYAWYRRTFEISADQAGRRLYLVLGRIDDVDEAFVNGRRIGGIGKFPPEFVSAWNLDRVYPIPDGLVDPSGPNLVAVRVYDHQLGGGIRVGDVGIYASELPEPLVDLAGVWRLRTGDDPAWKEEPVDESEFTAVTVPGYWDFLGLDRHDGHAWYRKSFDLDDIPQERTLVLLLGKVDDTDETYLNGELIGSTGTSGDDVDQTAAWNRRRAYEFPSSLLKERNVLAVRVHDAQQYGGIYEGPLGIMTKEDHDRYWATVEENRHAVIKPVIDWLLGRD